MVRPLQNIRVLDFTRFFAGPFCTMLLGDYGADVIKVESKDGDEQRLQGPPFVGDQSTGFMAVNRNKRSISVDLKQEEGRQIVRKLIQSSDVIVENFKTGTADKLGIGYEDAVKLKRDIIYCSISGYGDIGPNASTPAYDPTIQAFSGFMSMNGIPGGEPVKPGVSICDLLTGVYAFSAIEGALLRREQMEEKEPQRVRTSLFECITTYLTDAAVDYWLTGRERKALGSYHANVAPYGAYKAKDGYIVIGAGHTHMFKRLCEILCFQEYLTDERYMNTGFRYAHREEIKRKLEKELSTQKVAYWVELLQKNGIPSSPVNSIGTALDSEQSVAMGMRVQLEHPLFGAMNLLGPA